MLFKKKEVYKPLTMEESIVIANEGFGIETVRDFAKDAPTRELFEKIEEIKGTIQRVIAYDRWEYVGDHILYFEENAEKLTEFFSNKGFDNEYSISTVNNKTSLHLELKW